MPAPSILDLQADVTAVQSALLADGATTLGTLAYTCAGNTLGQAISDIQAGAAVARANLDALITLGAEGDGVFAFDTAANAALALIAATSVVGYLAVAAQANAYLVRAAKNLANAST